MTTTREWRRRMSLRRNLVIEDRPALAPREIVERRVLHGNPEEVQRHPYVVERETYIRPASRSADVRPTAGDELRDTLHDWALRGYLGTRRALSRARIAGKAALRAFFSGGHWTICDRVFDWPFLAALIVALVAVAYFGHIGRAAAL